eukprot:gene21015-biopygen16327
MCSVDGCSSTVSARGLCSTHGRGPCLIEGCTTKAQARGLCGKHGANGTCATAGCVTNARKRGGHCSKHSTKVACAAPNCSTPLVVGKGVCVKHGAFGICTAWRCKTNARTGKKGLCLKHSKDKPICSASGCSNGVVARGLCYAHGANGFCVADGCNTGAIKDGLCSKHGAKKKLPRGFGRCYAHGGGKKQKRKPWRAAPPPRVAKASVVNIGGGKDECKIAGCSNRIYGFLKACQKHGGSGYCQHPSGCLAPATKYGAYCKKHTKKEMMD